MKIMVTGIGGQLGYDVAKYLSKIKDEVIAPSHLEFDITNKDLVYDFFKKNSPDALIHCAAYTNVDLAEDNEIECRKTNVEGTRHLVEQCKSLNIPMAYISSDYVFSGVGNQPWKVDDTTSPINVYGLSKRDGENIVKTHDKYFIIRTSWLFGLNGKNFVKTMINLSKKVDTVKVVADQFGSPTYTHDLAPLICKMIKTQKYGVYHAHNNGFCSWYDVAIETFNVANIRMNVIPISTNEYSTKAKRPLNSRLDTSILNKNGFSTLPDWKEAINHYVKCAMKI